MPAYWPGMLDCQSVVLAAMYSEIVEFQAFRESAMAWNKGSANLWEEEPWPYGRARARTRATTTPSPMA